MTYTQGQSQALELLQQWWKSGNRQVFKLSGYAGTGKTVTIAGFADLLSLHGHIKYCAYTGKACQVMRRRGLNSCTIHRLIYEVDKSSKKPKFHLKQALDDNSTELIVIDEASMVDGKIFRDLCSFGKRIVVVGDPGQLPPIQGKSQCLEGSDITLTEIVRQAADNPIIALATCIRRGQTLQYGTFNHAIPIVHYNDLKDEFLAKADQILCGTNRTRHLLNDRLRQHYGFFDPLPMVGEKLISLKNMWGQMIEDQVVVNGTTGIVKRLIGKSPDEFRMLFQPDGCATGGVIDSVTDVFMGREPEYRSDPEHPTGVFDFGYAISVHKSQGSEWDRCLVIVDHDWGDMHAKWLYTACTRAKERLCVAIV